MFEWFNSDTKRNDNGQSDLYIRRCKANRNAAEETSVVSYKLSAALNVVNHFD